MMSVAFAVLTAVFFRSLQLGVFEHLVDTVVSHHTGFIQIHKKGYQAEQVIANSFSDDSTFTYKWKSCGENDTLLRRLENFCLAAVNEKTRGVLVIGTEPNLEDHLTGINTRITSGIGMKNQSGVWLGEELAKELGVNYQDTLVLFGQGYEDAMAAGKYPVAGTVKITNPELSRSLLYLPLSEAQVLFNAPGRITTAVVLAKKERTEDDRISSMRACMGADYETVGWKEMMPDIENHMRADKTFFWIEIGILYFVIGFGIFGTLLMMTNERKRENGMLLAIGMQKRKLGAILFGETVAIGITGALIGLLISLPIISYLESHPMRFSGRMAEIYQRYGFEPIFPTVLRWEILFEQAAIVSVLTILIGFYPLSVIHRTDPLKSIKDR
ncbi:MAG: ABC transporter permease [Bacteroidota bacterium]